MTKAKHLFDSLLMLSKSAKVPEVSKKAVRYSLNHVGISQRLEVLFHNAASRFSMLSYGAAWEHTLSNSDDVPSPSKSDTMNFRFHDFDSLKGDAAKTKNSEFSAWLSGQILRDLSEYLVFHLLEVYEVCLLVSLHKEELSEDDVTEAKDKVLSFEKGGSRDRFRRLLKEFGIRVPFKEAILSLYDARNVFAHSSGVVEKRYCDKKGQFRIQWPANKSFLIKRDTGKRVAFHRVRKPFSAERYSHAQVEWLSKSRTVTYVEGDKVSVESKDFQELVFFYLYVTKELQSQIVDFFKKNDVLVTPAESYCGSYSWQFVGEDAPLPVRENK